MRLSSDRTNGSTEADELWRARYNAAVAEFVAGRESVAVFRARLHGLSFTPSAISSEVNLHSGEKYR